MISRKKILFAAIMLLFIGISFQLPDSISKKDIPNLVRAKIDQEVKEYYADRLRICKLEVLTKAEDYVDSIIVNKISLTVLKGIYFPNRPVRPQSPAEIKLDDTTKIVAPK